MMQAWSDEIQALLDEGYALPIAKDIVAREAELARLGIELDSETRAAFRAKIVAMSLAETAEEFIAELIDAPANVHVFARKPGRPRKNPQPTRR
jgi:hypothetical protein